MRPKRDAYFELRLSMIDGSALTSGPWPETNWKFGSTHELVLSPSTPSASPPTRQAFRMGANCASLPPMPTVTKVVLVSNQPVVSWGFSMLLEIVPTTSLNSAPEQATSWNSDTPGCLATMFVKVSAG